MQYLRSFGEKITNEWSKAKESAKYHESCVSVHQSCLSTAIQPYAELSVIFLNNVLLFADTAWDFHNLSTAIQPYAELSVIFLNNVLSFADTAWDFHNLEVILLIGVGKHHQQISDCINRNDSYDH